MGTNFVEQMILSGKPFGPMLKSARGNLSIYIASTLLAPAV